MFQTIERTLCDWFDASGYETDLEDGEWVVEIGGQKLSVTALALAATNSVLANAAT